MLNNIFPFIVQAAVQPIAQVPTVTEFQSAATYIDDEIRLLILGY